VLGKNNASFRRVKSSEMSMVEGSVKDVTHGQRIKIILKLVIPSTLQCISNMMVEIINLIFIGALNKHG